MPKSFGYINSMLKFDTTQNLYYIHYYLMNPDLEKLLDYALPDSYITDKEKQVLVQKAQVSGFDIYKLEMILEGKLHEISKTNMQQVHKCPSCREIISGLSRVCLSCDYIADTEPFENSVTLKKLEDSLHALRAVPEPGTSVIFKYHHP